MFIKMRRVVDCFTSAKYYDTNITLWDDRFNGLVSEIKNRCSDMSFFRKNGYVFIVDLNLLSRKVNLDCFHCNNQNGCCNGKPHKISYPNKQIFELHASDIVEQIKAVEPEVYNGLIANGGFVMKGGTINAYRGRCSFLMKDGNSNKCSIHLYADTFGISPYDICPLSCLMFPIDIVEFKGWEEPVYFVTAVTDPVYWSNFGRWANYDEYYENFDARCMSVEKCGKKIFKLSEYIPAYLTGKGLLEHEFGVSFYAELCKRMEAWMRDG